MADITSKAVIVPVTPKAASGHMHNLNNNNNGGAAAALAGGVGAESACAAGSGFHSLPSSIHHGLSEKLHGLTEKLHSLGVGKSSDNSADGIRSRAGQEHSILLPLFNDFLLEVA